MERRHRHTVERCSDRLDLEEARHPVVERLLPEWTAVRGRVQRNALHRYTVDRHLCETAAVASFLQAGAPTPRGIKDSFDCLDLRVGANRALARVADAADRVAPGNGRNRPHPVVRDVLAQSADREDLASAY